MNPESPSSESGWSRRRWIKLRPDYARIFRSGRTGFRRRHLTLPKLLCGNEAGADQFAAAPDQRAHPKHLTARGEGKAEQFGHREVADFETGAVLGNVDHMALDPRRIRRWDQESGFAQVDPDMLARTEIFAVSGHDFPQAGKSRRKYLIRLPKNLN